MAEVRLPQWRPTAWGDIESHAVSLGNAGQKFLDRVNETVELLCTHPQLGGKFESINPRLFGIRAKLVTDFPRYVVLYRPHAEAIEIVRVLVGGQDMHALIGAEI